MSREIPEKFREGITFGAAQPLPLSQPRQLRDDPAVHADHYERQRLHAKVVGYQHGVELERELAKERAAMQAEGVSESTATGKARLQIVEDRVREKRDAKHAAAAANPDKLPSAADLKMLLAGIEDAIKGHGEMPPEAVKLTAEEKRMARKLGVPLDKLLANKVRILKGDSK